jgi:hypothetical protein
MKQRLTLVVGGLLLFAGCATGLYLIVTITTAQLLGIFSAIVTDAPSNTFTALNCPLLLSRTEASHVSVSITNPTQDSLEYAVTLAAAGLTMDAPSQIQDIVIAGHQTTTLVWTITAVEAGNQTMFVQALSNRDRAQSGPFHTWPTSFQQGCGVFVMDTPLTGAQVMWLIGLGILAGVVLVFSWLSSRRHNRRARNFGDDIIQNSH